MYFQTSKTMINAVKTKIEDLQYVSRGSSGRCIDTCAVGVVAFCATYVFITAMFHLLSSMPLSLTHGWVIVTMATIGGIARFAIGNPIQKKVYLTICTLVTLAFVTIGALYANSLISAKTMGWSILALSCFSPIVKFSFSYEGRRLVDRNEERVRNDLVANWRRWNG